MKTLTQRPLLYRLPVCLLLGGVMFVFILMMTPFSLQSRGDLYLIALLFSALYVAVTAVFCFEKNADDLSLLFLAAGAAALVFMRVCMLYFTSNDYNNFLSKWLAEMRTLPGFEALRVKIGDYNLPYLYFLFILSKLHLNDLVLIKWFSCIFDFAAAYFVMKCVEVKTQNVAARYGAFLLTLALPTVLLNGAYWGQCDSILAAFCAAALYYALCGRGAASVVAYSLAFIVKLQAIFLAPVMIICLIIGRIRLRHTLLFPAVFFALMIPALLAGRSLKSCVAIYLMQAAQYKRLTMNAPSFYQLFYKVDFEPFNAAAIMLAGLAALLLVFVCLKYKARIGNEQLVTLFYFSSLLIPYFLPRMHDRYFFLADILSVTVFFYNRKKWYVPLVTVLASFNAYMSYLSGYTFTFINQIYTSLALLILLCVLSVDLIQKLSPQPPADRQGS